MAKAAYCSECCQNVYLDANGRCPAGHGPESLSNYYDVADPAQYAQQPIGTDQMQLGAPKKRNTLVIVLVVLLALGVCGVIAAAVLGGAIFSIADKSVQSAVEEAAVAPEDVPAEDITDVAADDLQRMVEYFYPGFEAISFYQAGGEEVPGEGVPFHVIAMSADIPGFYLSFFANRTESTEPVASTDPVVAYFDDTAKVWWLHPEAEDHGLASVFGSNALVPHDQVVQIGTDFVAAHPEKLVTYVSDLTNASLAFQGIDQGEVEEWYDDFESFESTWKLDMAANPSVWRESGYEEF